MESEENKKFKKRESDQKEKGMSGQVMLEDVEYESFRKQTGDEYRRKSK